MAYGITSEAQLIDIAQINRGCSQIDDAASKYTQVGNEVSSVNCGSSALLVDGKTMQPSIDIAGNSIKSMEGEVKAFTSSIRSQAQMILMRQKAELQAYREEQARIAREKAEAAKNNN